MATGDTISIKVSEEAPELDQLITIDGAGTVILSRLKKIYISGLTIGELTNILNKEYSKYVLKPDIKIEVTQYRPIQIYVDGEVENPGLHVLKGSSSPLTDNVNFSNENQTSIEESSFESKNIFFPTVINALRKSGGITTYANLENIKITRIKSISVGGGRKTTKINLIDTLDLKSNSQNIRILDGDTIFVSRNEEPVISQISKAIKAKINPKFIQIGIYGRVSQPGTIKINKSATLNEALALSGGLKFLKGKLRFIRYNIDGTVDSREFRYNSRAKRGVYKNPFLKNGDIVFVDKSALNITNEVLQEITSPLQGILSTYGFFKIITE